MVDVDVELNHNEAVIGTETVNRMETLHWLG